jgi:hypothetical protein
MKHTYLVFGILVVIVIVGCIQQSPNLEFSAGPCDTSINPLETDMGVQEVVWSDDTTLVVTVLVGLNCAEEIEGGDFEILGNRIILVYTSPKCETCATCMCAHELTYTFTNLEKKEYQFELKRIS